MLSYHHAFHAGNHTDVFGRAVLMQMLDYLMQKDKSFWYINTHVGADLYALNHEWVQERIEFDTDIDLLWCAAESNGTLPPLSDVYLDQVCKPDPSGELRHCPNSPWLA